MNYKNYITSISAILLYIQFIMIPRVCAKDLGNYGQIFEIKEQGFIVMIQERLKNVDIDKENKKMRAKAVEQVNNPKPVFAILPANRTRVFYYDPSFILDEDVFLPCGTILYRSGTSVNPLDHMDLERELIFIDGRERKQISWLKGKIQNETIVSREGNDNNGSKLSNNSNQCRIILIGGSVFKVKEELSEFPDEIKEQVYFDQEGALVNKFGITHSPAVVMQEGAKLKIAEINIKEGRI